MPFCSLARCVVGLAFLVLLSACGTTQAPDFRGRWRPVNAAASTPVALPLEVAPTYTVTPADRSLRRVLERWAASADRELDWQAPMDFTLHADATRVAAARLDAAVASLEEAYAAQGLRVELLERRVRVSVRPQSAP